MLFQSREFLVYFLPVVLAGYVLLEAWQPRLSLAWLVLTSLVFYAVGELTYSLLFAGSVLANYACARVILDGASRRRAHAALVAGVVLNLAVLGWFKYAGFFGAMVGLSAPAQAASYALPLGISFYTFQKIAFLVDCYRGEVKAVRFEMYAVFVTFFPQLIAGPIVHHKELIPQFERGRRRLVNGEDFSQGAAIFLLGMFKKIALADNFSRFTDIIFGAADHGAAPPLLESWAGCLMFTLQIYFDFSAYSDMAIGIARMLGIRLPMNFDSPYQSASIIEFWRRWHMTLSRFLRDYVYITLGGNRHGRWRRHANLMITMLVGGLWHGANWTFIAWGGIHGAALAANHLLRHLFGARESRAGRLAGWAVTLLAVMVAWVVFRAGTFSGALDIYRGMLGLNGIYLIPTIASHIPGAQSWLLQVRPLGSIGDGTATDFAFAAMLCVLGLALVLFSPNVGRMSQRARLAVIVFTFGFCLQHVVANGPADSFIYFRF